MREVALIRCDFFKGSGVGHLKRCNTLGKALKKFGVDSTLILDAETGLLPITVDLPLTTFKVPKFNEVEDADKLIELATEKGARLIIGDSYRITAKWVDAIKQAGLSRRCS